jgi:hypothetical protein
VCAVTSYDGFSSLSWTCQRAQRALRGFGRQLAAITGGDFALHLGSGSRPPPSKSEAREKLGVDGGPGKAATRPRRTNSIDVLRASKRAGAR